MQANCRGHSETVVGSILDRDQPTVGKLKFGLMPNLPREDCFLPYRCKITAVACRKSGDLPFLDEDHLVHFWASSSATTQSQ